MSDYLAVLVALLLVTLLMGLARVVRGPSRADRMLAAQLFATTGVAVLLLLALVFERAALLDVALVLALLAPVTAVAFVQLAGGARS